MFSELPKADFADMTINLKARMITECPEKVYGDNANYLSLTRWMARWYKCYAYRPSASNGKQKGCTEAE